MKALIKDLESLNRHDTLDATDHELIATTISKLKDLSEQEKKTYYFLFGETASRLYHEEDFTVYLKTVKEKDLEFAVHKFIEGEHPENIMEASSGWGDYATISEQEYNALTELKDEQED